MSREVMVSEALLGMFQKFGVETLVLLPVFPSPFVVSIVFEVMTGLM